MKRFLIALVCLLLLVCHLSVVILADTTRDVSYEEEAAQYLKDLGLFKGVTDTDFDLKRAPTRLEALVMLIRLLGKEQDLTLLYPTHTVANFDCQ